MSPNKSLFLYAFASLGYSVIATEGGLGHTACSLPSQSDVVQESCRSTFQHFLPSVEALVCCLGSCGPAHLSLSGTVQGHLTCGAMMKPAGDAS